jgi:hypothetical protein
MASSIHDAGYPLEYGRHIIGKLGNLYSNLGMGHYSRLFDSVDAQLSGMAQQQNPDVGVKGPGEVYLNVPNMVTNLIVKSVHADHDILGKTISNKWGWQDHGLVGAAILSQALLMSGKIKPGKESAELTALESASTAMALHNFGSDELRFTINFDRLPYAFLLMVVNELQEWNYPAKGRYGRESCFDLSSVELKPSAGRRIIRLTFAMPADAGSGALQALRDQLNCKRRKLANLNYGSASGNCDEIEIHAVYHAGGEHLGAITVLILHKE